VSRKRKFGKFTEEDRFEIGVVVNQIGQFASDDDIRYMWGRWGIVHCEGRRPSGELRRAWVRPLGWRQRRKCRRCGCSLKPLDGRWS
jgi:hypothetical protein